MRKLLPLGVCLVVFTSTALLTGAEPAKRKPGFSGIPQVPAAQSLTKRSPQTQGVTIGPNVPAGGGGAALPPLDDAALEAALVKLGYEVKFDTYMQGEKTRKIFLVAAKNYWIGVALGNEDEDLLLFANLTTIADPDRVMSQRLLELLSIGDNFYGHFVYNPPSGETPAGLKAIKGIANMNVNLPLLKRTIDNFDHYLSANKDAWDPENWK